MAHGAITTVTTTGRRHEPAGTGHRMRLRPGRLCDTAGPRYAPLGSQGGVMVQDLGGLLLFLTLLGWGLAMMVSAHRLAGVRRVLSTMLTLSLLMLLWPILWNSLIWPMLAGLGASVSSSLGSASIPWPTWSAPSVSGPTVPTSAGAWLSWYGALVLVWSAIYTWARVRERSA